MVEMMEIRNTVQRIAEMFHPERIVLFGSYATGNPTPDSDVDVLVIMPFQGKTWKMASNIRWKIRARFPMDLLVRTPEQISERLKGGDSFLQEILQNGVTLYEA